MTWILGLIGLFFKTLGELAATRIGLATLIIVGGYIFYEGIPVPDFVRRVPFVGTVIVEQLTEGRVKRQVRRAVEIARAGYVKEVELIAANAKLAEAERQLAAGRKALDGYAKLLADAQAGESAATEQAEKAIADYEKILAGKGKSRPLDQSDIDWLRH